MTMTSLIISMIVFILLPFVTMSVLIFLPRFLGRYLPPSFSFNESISLNESVEDIYTVISDYENYPSIFRDLKKIEVELLPSGKKNIYEYYSFRKMIDLMVVREEQNKLCSLVRRTYEYTSLWTFYIEEKSEDLSHIHLKETIYVYDNYLRFILRYILRGTLQRKTTLYFIKKYFEKLRKNNAKI